MRNNRRAGHNGAQASDEVPNIVGAGTPTQHTRRRHVWTPESRRQLLACHEAASPGRRGYMKRLHQLWSVARPEMSYMSQQQLRNHVEFLRLSDQPQNTGEEDGPVRTSPQRRRVSIRRPPSLPMDLLPGFLAAVTNAEDRTRAVHHKHAIRAEDLSRMNDILKGHLSPASDLWEVDCAVYAAASVLCPENPKTSGLSRDDRRIQQLSSKVTRARREASRIQCVIDVLRANQTPSRWQKSFMKVLHLRYHTTKLSTLHVLKQKSVDSLRALTVARERLLNKQRWIKENNIFRSNPSRLFKREPPSPKVSPKVVETERFWRTTYDQYIVIENTPVLERFQRFCDEGTGRRCWRNSVVG